MFVHKCVSVHLHVSMWIYVCLAVCENAQVCVLYYITPKQTAICEEEGTGGREDKVIGIIKKKA